MKLSHANTNKTKTHLYLFLNREIMILNMSNFLNSLVYNNVNLIINKQEEKMRTMISLQICSKRTKTIAMKNQNNKA